MEFELSSEPGPYILGLVGAVVGVFTVSGGFNSGGFETPGGIIMKVGVAIGGFLIGYMWGVWKSSS